MPTIIPRGKAEVVVAPPHLRSAEAAVAEAEAVHQKLLVVPIAAMGASTSLAAAFLRDRG